MNFESISSMARSHRDDLIAQAARHRALRAGAARTGRLRLEAARIARAMGRACLSFGDALAQSR